MLYFDVDISKKGRTCGVCSGSIRKGEKLFVLFNYDKTVMKYPIRKNVCLECSFKLTQGEFLSFLRKLYNALLESKRVVERVRR